MSKAKIKYNLRFSYNSVLVAAAAAAAGAFSVASIISGSHFIVPHLMPYPYAVIKILYFSWFLVQNRFSPRITTSRYTTTYSRHYSHSHQLRVHWLFLIICRGPPVVRDAISRFRRSPALLKMITCIAPSASHAPSYYHCRRRHRHRLNRAPSDAPASFPAILLYHVR